MFSNLVWWGAGEEPRAEILPEAREVGPSGRCATTAAKEARSKAIPCARPQRGAAQEQAQQPHQQLPQQRKLPALPHKGGSNHSQQFSHSPWALISPQHCHSGLPTLQQPPPAIHPSSAGAHSLQGLLSRSGRCGRCAYMSGRSMCNTLR